MTFEDSVDTEALTKKWKARSLLPFKVCKVTSVNHKPHPFTVGPRHIAHASDHCGGMLGRETMLAIPCAAKGCGLAAREHSYDVVLFLELTRNTTNEEAGAVLEPITKDLEQDRIDGIAFVETDEKFRIESPKNKEDEADSTG